MKRMKGKRGQFFILAAVMIAVFLLSMAYTTNKVFASEPDYGFHDYADNIERESDFLLDYEVYSGLGTQDLDHFVEVLEADFRDREVAGNFMFIYGNSTLTKVRNIGTQGITVDGAPKPLKGSSGSAESKIRISGFTVGVDQFVNQDTELILEEANLGDSIDIVFNGYSYNFPVSDVNQVIFIVQKEFNDETFVEVR